MPARSATAAPTAYRELRRGGDASRTVAPPDGGLRHHQVAGSAAVLFTG